MNDWLTMLTDASQMFLFLAFELSVLFLVISAGVSLIRQKIPDAKIQAMLGARKGRGYLISAVLGALTLTIPSYERGVARLLRYDRHP